jgi:hypothetical protein
MICMDGWNDDRSTLRFKIPPALLEKSVAPSRRKGLPAVTEPPAPIEASSEMPTVPPPTKKRAGHRTAVQRGAEIEVVTAGVRHDPRREG